MAGCRRRKFCQTAFASIRVIGPVSIRAVVFKDLFKIACRLAVNFLKNLVFLGNCQRQFFAEYLLVIEIDQAYPRSQRFIAVTGPDAAAGGSDFQASFFSFTQTVNLLVVGENKVSA